MIDAVGEVDQMKKRLGARVRELRVRAGRKQEDLAEAAGIGRDIISDIETATTDYRIESLLSVLAALKADETVENADDSIEEILKKKLVTVLRKGDPADRNFIMSIIERAAGTIDNRQPTARSGPSRKSLPRSVG